ncbi:IclR family transcriptional regulator [Pseudooceanicola sp. MF1-13]|uniref:IclR family transcriptional regulator n=1 Tax=Pseudooceanicola sp. MF1-13 TaxID=3379095 RepID=UPI003891E691
MGTIRKVGDVLRLFSEREPELGLSDIARRMNMSTSGTHDVLDELRKIGMLTRVARGRYRLGPFIASLYRVLVDTSALVATARPTLERLVEDYGETVHLTVFDRTQVIVADAVEGRHMLRVSRAILEGDLAPHESPVGMLHLAAAGKTRQEASFAAVRAHRTPLLPPQRLAEYLEELAREGVAVGPVETERDVICVAAQVRNHADMPYAVLSLAIPRSRHDAQSRAFRTVVMTAAEGISQQLSRS